MKKIKSRFDANALTFIETKQSWSVSTALWLNTCSDTSMLSKCVRQMTKKSAEWVARLPAVVSAINNEVTRLIAKKTKAVSPKPATKYTRPVGLNEKSSPPSLMFGICVNEANLMAAADALQILFGL